MKVYNVVDQHIVGDLSEIDRDQCIFMINIPPERQKALKSLIDKGRSFLAKKMTNYDSSIYCNLNDINEGKDQCQILMWPAENFDDSDATWFVGLLRNILDQIIVDCDLDCKYVTEQVDPFLRYVIYDPTLISEQGMVEHRDSGTINLAHADAPGFEYFDGNSWVDLTTGPQQMVVMIDTELHSQFKGCLHRVRRSDTPRVCMLINLE